MELQLCSSTTINGQTPYNNATYWKSYQLLQNERCVCWFNCIPNCDVVRYGGHTYVAKQDATGVVPTTTASWIN